MPLDKKLHFYLSGKPTVSNTGCGHRPKHGTLLDLPLNEAFAILMARREEAREVLVKSEKRPSAEERITGQGERTPIPKIRLRKIGSSTYSLENIDKGDKDGALKIIFKPSAESGDQCQNTATEIQIPEYPKCTPYQAVVYLADRGGIPIEILIGRLKNVEDQGDHSHKWRCMIISGYLNVMVDSKRKLVARDMAAVKFLERLASMDKPIKIPKYTILPELFIDPLIFHLLEKEANRRGMNVANYMKTRQVNIPKRKQGGGIGGDNYVAHLYVSTFVVDKAIYKGESFVQEYAELLAAKRAYEDLTKTEVTPTKYFTGGLCDPTLEYDFGDNEIHQERIIMESEKVAPKDTHEAMRKKARVELSESFRIQKTRLSRN